jgi:hypothetical protein
MFCNDMDEKQTRFVLDNFGRRSIVAERVIARSSADIPRRGSGCWRTILTRHSGPCIANLERRRAAA